MTERIVSVEFIRGLAMLGVIGIHTGSFMIANPQANMHLFALFEIVSRFSVPIFFFVSAFALFRQYPLAMPFDAAQFYRRRIAHVLLPYILWSVFYMLHYSLTFGDWDIWKPRLVYNYILFGAGSYQLYFLVILLWFYLLMPLWRAGVRFILQRPFFWLGLLLLAQIAFNYYSSYSLRPRFASYYANLFIQYRMSYWPFHYVFLFLLGGVVASRYAASLTWLRQNRRFAAIFFWSSLAALLAHYYYLLLIRHCSLEQAVNLAHQLSPAGVLYSVAASLYLLLRFESPLPVWAAKLLSVSGRYSYNVFLVHPLVMFYLDRYLTGNNLTMTVTITLVFYLATVLTSFAYAWFAQSVQKKCRF